MKISMTKRRKAFTIVILGLLSAIVPFSIDMYLPGFPDIARSLGTTVSRVALSLSSFFVGIAIGQLAYGPILERFGRKTPLYAGLALYCIASVGCSFAGSIEVLIALRLVQAIGACSAAVAATAMVRDLFPPGENAQIFSFLMLVVSASPMLAPTLGGAITDKFGWSAIFLVLTVLIAAILLCAFFFLPESKPADQSYSLDAFSILQTYKSVVTEPYFKTYSFAGAMSYAGLFTYIASSPGIFMGSYGLSRQQYGFLFAFMALGLIIASQVNSFWLKSRSSEQIVARVLVAQILLGLGLVVLSVLHLTGFWIVVALLFGFLSTVGFIMPNSSALSMQPFAQNAGSAAALLGFVQMGLGSLASVVVGVLDIKTVLPMSLALVLCSAVGLAISWGGRTYSKVALNQA